ncbi:hypothetical protein L798_08657 [Zootermopsis nevadensis]|uniref:Uncharacterized protein n=1 Tax=Zootermopsis nevadensis TaxID=136037 RepID=A0A067RRY3_ZOONE|nr:hypothetical protein L798_08657 [Zootermopsis nevadensis]
MALAVVIAGSVCRELFVRAVRGFDATMAMSGLLHDPTVLIPGRKPTLPTGGPSVGLKSL